MLERVKRLTRDGYILRLHGAYEVVRPGGRRELAYEPGIPQHLEVGLGRHDRGSLLYARERAQLSAKLHELQRVLVVVLFNNAGYRHIHSPV